MAKGISLHVGINDAGPNFPTAATLFGAENDARAMKGIAEAHGFATRDLLLGSCATYANVKAKIESAAAALTAGDIFLFTFAGHGSQQADELIVDDEDHIILDEDENGGDDEVLVLFDQYLFDDEIRRNFLPLFAPGVRVLGVVDACHSQSIFAGPPPPDLDDHQTQMPIHHVREGEIPVIMPGGRLARTMAIATRREHMTKHRDIYSNTLVPLVSEIRASVLLLAACPANQTTGDGDPNGVFTAAMLKVLSGPGPIIDYEDLRAKIDAEPQTQTPMIDLYGPDIDFEKQKPFLI